jgi:DUF971 family protein
MIASVRPVKLSREGDDFLVIDWSDGRHDRLRWTDLRKSCPCATCNEERLAPPDPFRILSPGELTPLKPVSIQPIGLYAYKIVWSDGHDAGLFTLEHLRELGDRQLS